MHDGIPNCLSPLDSKFSGYVFCQHPWFQSISRAKYQDGVAVEYAELCVSGWHKYPLRQMNAFNNKTTQEGVKISRQEVIEAFSYAVYDVSNIKPESAFLVIPKGRS